MTRQPSRRRPKAPPAPPPPRSERDIRISAELSATPLWKPPNQGVYVQHNVQRLDGCTRQTFSLPPYQRQAVWTPEMQRDFTHATWSGTPIAPLTIWRHKGVSWLLDGQQRCIALGLTVLSHDGVPRPAPSTRFDWLTGEWTLDRGEPCTLARMCQIARFRYSDDDLFHDSILSIPGMVATRINASSHAQDITVPATVFDSGWNHGMTTQQVVQIFRAMATPGVPWDPAEIERTIASVGDWSPSVAGEGA